MSTSVFMVILPLADIVLKSLDQEMSAAGRLPLCKQNNTTEPPAMIVCVSGLITKEFKISVVEDGKMMKLNLSLLFLY